MAHIKGNNPAGQTLSWAQGVTNDDDLIEGNAGADWIFAQGGDDTIKGGGGADWLDGGSGDDTVLYGNSLTGVDVNLATGKGKGGTAEGDTLKNIENVVGSDFNDILTGNAEDNTLQGGKGNDVLKGGGGFDRLLGGEGNDIIESDGHDVVNGGDGVDTLMITGAQGVRVYLESGEIYRDGDAHGHYSSHRLIANMENVAGSPVNDTIAGNSAKNTLNGLGGDDKLFGNAGDDQLFGDIGNDLLNGGAGADQLTGGAGQDTFQYSTTIESYMLAGKPLDTIMDFQKGTDKIDLTALDLDYGDLKKVNNFNFEGENYSYFGVDANNNGVFDVSEFVVAVKMVPGTSLSASDFLF